MRPVPGAGRLRAARALALGLAAASALALAGCSSGRIDPPRGGEQTDEDTGPAAGAAAPDSMAAWASRARDDWASGDAMRADRAAALAREAFTSAWGQAAEGLEDARHASTTERLPSVSPDLLPSASAVAAELNKVGLAADIAEAQGAPGLWQVSVSDPLGTAGAATEFWAWADPKSGGALPVVQTLPPRAPARRRYGPEGVGGLVSSSDGKKAYLASAWARPRGRGGLEIALAVRPLGGQGRYAITSNQVLPVEADSVAFVPAAGGSGGAGAPPALLVSGAGERDRLFDDCPTCPHLDRVQRYVHAGDQWRLSEERIRPTPYAALVSFVHALREGTPDSALPWVADPAVIEAARNLGLDRPTGALRAMPGTSATDVTQRYRLAGGIGIEVTLEPRGDHWVVGDLRPAPAAIE